jgi:hypothetical protein
MITERELKQGSLMLALKKAGMTVDRIEHGEPTLEDVFLSLARG